MHLSGCVPVRTQAVVHSEVRVGHGVFPPNLLYPSALRWGSSLIQKLIVLSRLFGQQTLGVHLSLTPNAEVTGMYGLV